MSALSPGLTLPAHRGWGTSERCPALLWSLLHVPIFLTLFASGIGAAVRATPEAYRALLWPTFLPQATFLALVAWLLALPLSVSTRAYHFAAPAAAAFVTAAVALGAWFVRRFASGRRAWTLALALALLSTAERVYGATLVYFAGPSIFAASTVLPLQPPIRMGTIARKVFGKREGADPFAGTSASKRLPAGVAPEAIRLERTPDVLFIAAESLPVAHLSADTMPRLWRRAQEGAVFERHYAGASSTNYTLFTLMYGLQAQKLEATVGAGRRPVLFPALAANGYRVKVLAASCVDWMDLKDTVFGGVPVEDLKTWC